MTGTAQADVAALLQQQQAEILDDWVKAQLTDPLTLKHEDDEPQQVTGWDEIAKVIEELGRKGLQIQR